MGIPENIVRGLPTFRETDEVESKNVYTIIKPRNKNICY